MESRDLDIKRYLNLIDRKKGLFMITAMAVMTLALLYSYLKPKVYEAHSTILIEKNVITDLVKGIAVTPSMQERIKVLSYAIKNRNLLLKVIDEVNFQVDKNDPVELEKLLEHLQEKTKVRVRKGNMITVSYTNKDPKLARDYVNTLVNQYIEENLSAKREEAYGANRFLKEQIQFFKNKIDEAEKRIIEFRRSKGIIIALDERSVVSDIERLRKEIETLQIKKAELNAQKSLIEEQLKGERPYTVAIFERTSTGNVYAQRLSILQQRLNELLLKYTENYPEVIQLKAEIESLKEKMAVISKETSEEDPEETTSSEMSAINPIYLQLKERLSKINTEIAALEAKEKHYKRQLSLKKAYLKDIPAERKKLADLERERDTFKEIYEKLLFRLGQSEVSKQMEVQDKAETFKIVEPAILPVEPVSPNRKLIIFFGIFAGLGAGFGLLLLIDYLDTSVKTVETLKALGLQVLAIIPTIEDPIKRMHLRRRNILLYTTFTLYMLFVMAIFTVEFLGLPYIDDFVTNLHLRERVLEVATWIKELIIR